MEAMKIRVPKPVLRFADFNMFTAYAWYCEHKKTGVISLGNTAEEAKREFKANCIGELGTAVVFV